jgi:hypothetical protein
MTRIFLTLAILANLALVAALWLGYEIGDATLPDREAQAQVSVHFLTGLGALCFAVLVHAIVLTYFMGTGRWLEETSNAYALGADWGRRSKDLKWYSYPTMTLALLMLIATGAFGGAADPASAFGFRGWGQLSAAEVHQYVAIATLAANVFVNVLEFRALRNNGRLVTDVLAEVRRIRLERGLPV